MPAVIAVILLLVSMPSLAATSTVTTTTNSNGTTLPFQRHVVRLQKPGGGALLVAAVQRQGAGGEGLVLFTSGDGGASWQRDQPVQNDHRVRDTADLLPDPDGRGFSLLYGVEPSSSQFAVNREYDVVYLHYALRSDGALRVDRGPVVVFAASSSRAWFRPSLTRDALGVLHASATRLDGGRYTFWHRLSIDGGLEWTDAERLVDTGSSFGGGRVIAYGSRVAAIYDSYDGKGGARFRSRPAGPCAEWEREEVITSDGLYHAGAFSVTATPNGRLHLGYSTRGNQSLRYREYDGQNWSAAETIESRGWWANQPAVSHRGNEVFYAWNRNNGDDTQRIHVRKRRADGSWEAAEVVDDRRVHKGYTTALEEVLPGEPLVVLWSEDASSGPALVRCAPVQP